MATDADLLQKSLKRRFGGKHPLPDGVDLPPSLAKMASRGSHRTFSNAPIDPELVRILCAIALASPTKSDLQQRDIIIVDNDGTRSELIALIGTEDWVAGARTILVFCGNNRRQRKLHEWRDREFVNDHLDAFFNAAIDAGIALSAFVTAAEAAGLGCCPISAVRNRADDVSSLLQLPDHVFPVAGLALGYPVGEPVISMRLPLSVTVHHDHYAEDNLEEAIAGYDNQRERLQPYANQRLSETYGEQACYSWSEDKTRQYSRPERQDFGTFIRAKGFKLD